MVFRIDLKLCAIKRSIKEITVTVGSMTCKKGLKLISLYRFGSILYFITPPIVEIDHPSCILDAIKMSSGTNNVTIKIIKLTAPKTTAAQKTHQKLF